VLLLTLASCWRETPAVVATIPEAPQVTIDPGTPLAAGASPKRDSPYREVAGTWSGDGFQYDTKAHWDFVMTLQARGEVGDVIGTIAYEHGSCTAELYRQPERDGGDTLAMTEKLLTGQGRCVDGGTVRIQRHPIAGQLEWKWDWADGHEGANATIKRD